MNDVKAIKYSLRLRQAIGRIGLIEEGEAPGQWRCAAHEPVGMGDHARE